MAREYGLPSWGELRAAVEAAQVAARPRAERALAFLEDACLDYQHDSPRRRLRAQRILAADPTLARHDVYTAAVCADAAALREMLSEDPGAASRPGGPRNWEPLLYLTYARLPEPSGDAVLAARVLLDAGADANAHVRLHGAYRFSALTGAMGEGEGGLVNQPPHPRARPLAELLLERGASPNDAQGLYNTHFTPGNEWLELLLARGLTARDPADWVDGEGAISTLDYQLGVAVRLGYQERVVLLLEHGADPNGRDFYDRRPHYENALLYGRPELARLLVEHGAEAIELAPASRFRAHCMQAEGAVARAMLDDDPSLIDDPRLVHDAVQHGRDDAVALVFELGGSLEAPDQHYGQSPLHRAALYGRTSVVELLVALGGRLDVRDPSFGGTPVGCAAHAGHETLRDWLLDRSHDVFDLARFGRLEQLRDLLAADPALARRTLAGGETPLHGLGTVGERGAAVIDLLLAHGADLDASDADGKTPLAAALERDDDEVAELLRERGAREP